MTLIYLIAGEQSGDAIGGRLIAALRAARPDLEFAGIGGPRMEEQGLTSLFPIRELAIMGLLEVLPRILSVSALLSAAVAEIRARRPAVLITIDSPGFTLRVLKRLKNSGLKRVHYVAPQVWAWRENRVKTFPGLWDRLLCLLPFEPAFFARHHLPASFVGHPVIESGADTGNAARFRTTHNLPPDAPILIVMPGSRRSEVTRLLPLFAETLTRLHTQFPTLIPVVPAASAVADTVLAATAIWPRPPIVITDLTAKHDAFAAAAAALTKSGTSTLELAMAGIPMVVTYKVNPITQAIAKRLIRVKYVAIVNLLANRPIVPELLMADCTPTRMAEEVARLLADPTAAATQRTDLAAIITALSPPTGLPSEAAAQEILALLADR